MTRLYLSLRLALCMAALTAVGSCASDNGNKPSDEETRKTSQEHVVQITQMKFVPAEIVVQEGDRVRFINHDLVPHDITEDPGKSWSSSLLPANESWSMTATKSCSYYCTLHPVMKGKITVQ